MARGILDTSTLILLGKTDADASLPDEPLITAITLAELSVAGIEELVVIEVPHPDR